MLAHELRNPLAPIRNAVQIMRLVGLKEPSLMQARDMIDRQVNHMARLVDDLLDVSRLSRGKILLRKQPLDLTASLGRRSRITAAHSRRLAWSCRFGYPTPRSPWRATRRDWHRSSAMY